MEKKFIMESIKKDIEELLEIKTKLRGNLNKLNIKQNNINNVTADEISLILDSALSQGNVDINQIPVRSPRPLIGWMITIIKRAIRKSTFWLYQPLFLKLTAFNTTIINTLKKLLIHIEDLNSQLNTQLQQIKTEQACESKLDIIEQKLSSIISIFEKNNDDIKNNEAEIYALNEKLNSLDEKRKDEIENCLAQICILNEKFDDLKNILEKEIRIHKVHIETLGERVTGNGIKIEDYNSSAKNDKQEIITLINNLKQLIENYRIETVYLRAKLAVALQQIMCERQSIDKSEDSASIHENYDKLIKEIGMDWIYHTFEHYFRGSENLIKERQKSYLQDIEGAYQQCGGFVLDIGSGRGEFLELCREHGIPAKGADLNEVMVEHCREKGLDVICADGISYLQNIPDETLCAITAFQVVEHLTPKQLLSLVQTAIVKLKAGGLIILETVNTDSLYSLKNFYLDLTHTKPIPSSTLRFLLEVVGFKNVKVVFSSPVSEDMKLSGDDENANKLNELLFGAQDYAVKGWK